MIRIVFSVRSLRGLPYRHYGIDLGDGTVVHFVGGPGLDPRSATVKRTSLEEFAAGGAVEEDIMCVKAFPDEEIARRALSKVGSDFGGYSLLKNNCEHFANWCASGERKSRQAFFMRDGERIGPKLMEFVADKMMRI